MAIFGKAVGITTSHEPWQSAQICFKSQMFRQEMSGQVTVLEPGDFFANGRDQRRGSRHVNPMLLRHGPIGPAIASNSSCRPAAMSFCIGLRMPDGKLVRSACTCALSICPPLALAALQASPTAEFKALLQPLSASISPRHIPDADVANAKGAKKQSLLHSKVC